MTRTTSFFASRAGILVAGAALGAIAVGLQALGNPANMGVCVACFTRDVAGALGLHRAASVQYLRPEIPAFCLGAFLAAVAFREFRPRTGSSPIQRFVLGALAVQGALIFLGCPWRAILRIAGGDWNAIAGILGLVAGIGGGVAMLRAGFSLGRSHPSPPATGLVLPAAALVLLVLAIVQPRAGADLALFRSASGPGAAAAPVAASVAAGLAIGFLAQRTRFCTVGGIRDVILMRDSHLLSGVVAFALTAFALNLILGGFHPGFVRGVSAEGSPIPQPAAHGVAWLNVSGMVLAGLSFTLAGGCPGRQVFLSGEGDGDAAVFVAGMLVGAALAHDVGTVGAAPLSGWAAGIGLVVVLGIGVLGIERPQAGGRG